MKKIISLILCLIFAFSFAVSAFAATSYDPTQGIPGNWAPPNNPTRPNLNAPMNPAPKDNPGVKDIVPEEEENPNTGAPVVLAVPAVITLVGAVAVITKRK
ncbi:MAG: hypothetical protein IKL18_09535 [Oscillospiraceae bacterium]|nr:hypothetical protein [Oscillospiraceae bacterium]